MNAVDTFTGTASTLLEAHTTDSGHTWTEHPSYTGGASALTDLKRVRGSSGPTALYLSAVPDSAEYDIEADFFVVTVLTGTCGIAGRMDTAANTFYYVRYNATGTQWELRTAAGSTLGSAVQTLTGGQTYHVKFQIRDAAKKVFVDGVEVISSTDNSITGAGRPGFFANSAAINTTGLHLDNFSATDPPAVTPAGMFSPEIVELGWF